MVPLRVSTASILAYVFTRPRMCCGMSCRGPVLPAQLQASSSMSMLHITSTSYDITETLESCMKACSPVLRWSSRTKCPALSSTFASEDQGNTKYTIYSNSFPFFFHSLHYYEAMQPPTPSNQPQLASEDLSLFKPM